MNREELLGWINSLIINSAELGEPSDAKSWGYEEGILISRAEAEEIRTHLSLHPAEGAEVTLPTDKDIAIEIVARFTANPHPNQRANYEREKKAFANGAIYMRELAQRVATLHAQRIADKMASNESAGAILLKFQSFVHNHMNGFVFDAWIIEYLKTREK